MTRRRERLALAAIALPCLVYAMDLSVLNLALPAISADLEPSATELLWIVDIYGFMVAGALITMGALGDRIGPRRMLMIGAAAFGATSVLAAFASSPEMLIAARALLGLAGATLAPSTLSLIRTLFDDPRRRTYAIGVWATAYSAGAAIGPLAGGVALEFFWWGSVLLLGVPVMALTLLVAPRLLPADAHDGSARLDFASAALSLGAVLAVIYGIKEAAVGGGPVAVAWIAAGLVAGAAFVRRQRRLDDPLIDVGLFRLPAFSAALGANLVAFFVIFGMAVFTAQYAQSVLGYSPFVAGLPAVTEALGFVAGSLLTARAVARWSAPALLSGGLLIGAAGYAIVTAGTFAALFVGPALGAIGIAVVTTLVADISVSAVPAERAGGAAATSETSSELGGALGIAVLGSLGAAIYGARESIGEAAAAGGPALEQARDAFATALTVTASVSALVLALTAAMTFTLLRAAGGDQPCRSSRAAPSRG